MHPETRQHINQAVRAEQIEPASQKVAHARLCNFQDCGGLDLLGPAHLTLKRDGRGRLSFLAIEVGLDYRVGQRDGGHAVEFSFEGSDGGDRISGRGWAILAADEFRGRIFIHHGDDSGFTACRSDRTAPHRKRIT